MHGPLQLNQEPESSYRSSPPHEGSGNSEDSQFGVGELNTPEASTWRVCTTVGIAGSGLKRTRDTCRGGRRNRGSMLSDSLDNMTSRLCSAMEARHLSSKGGRHESDKANYQRIVEDIKCILGWNEESM